MSPKSSHALFEPFIQVDGAPNRRRGGTGLGLAISQRIVEAMGGADRGRSSKSGEGSRFWFTLRLSVDDPPHVAVPDSAHRRT